MPERYAGPLWPRNPGAVNQRQDWEAICSDRTQAWVFTENIDFFTEPKNWESHVHTTVGRKGFKATCRRAWLEDGRAQVYVWIWDPLTESPPIPDPNATPGIIGGSSEGDPDADQDGPLESEYRCPDGFGSTCA